MINCDTEWSTFSPWAITLLTVWKFQGEWREFKVSAVQ